MQCIVHKHIENVLLRLGTTFKVQQRLLKTKQLLCLINTVPHFIVQIFLFLNIGQISHSRQGSSDAGIGELDTNNKQHKQHKQQSVDSKIVPVSSIAPDGWGPKEGGNATSPLHSRGSPTKGTKSKLKT